MQGWKSLPEKEYRNIHQWLKRQVGKANKCEFNCDTPPAGFDWALIHGKNYERKVENFMQLCKKCHHAYDEISRFGPAHPMYGKKHTEEARAKMSLNHGHGKPNLGGVASEETRRKMSLARKGIPKSEEHKRKIGLAHKGRYLSEEHKQKMRRPKTPEHIEKLRGPKSDEHKEKLREAQRKFWDHKRGITRT